MVGLVRLNHRTKMQPIETCIKICVYSQYNKEITQLYQRCNLFVIYDIYIKHGAVPVEQLPPRKFIRLLPSWLLHFGF